MQVCVAACCCVVMLFSDIRCVQFLIVAVLISSSYIFYYCSIHIQCLLTYNISRNTNQYIGCWDLIVMQPHLWLWNFCAIAVVSSHRAYHQILFDLWFVSASVIDSSVHWFIETEAVLQSDRLRGCGCALRQDDWMKLCGAVLVFVVTVLLSFLFFSCSFVSLSVRCHANAYSLDVQTVWVHFETVSNGYDVVRC